MKLVIKGKEGRVRFTIFDRNCAGGGEFVLYRRVNYLSNYKTEI